MTKLTYSQLEGVWIQGGGQASLAPLMAAIALAESGGQTNSLNPNDNHGTQSSYGLWQISTGTHAAPNPNWADPVENAKLAVGKLKSQGLGAWGTYTSGAYKPFLKNGVPPTSVTGGIAATDVSSGETGDSPGVDTATCAWQMHLPVAGDTCILSKTQLRAILGVGLIGVSVVTAIVGVAVLAAFTLGKQPGPMIGAMVKGSGTAPAKKAVKKAIPKKTAKKGVPAKKAAAKKATPAKKAVQAKKETSAEGKGDSDVTESDRSVDVQSGTSETVG